MFLEEFINPIFRNSHINQGFFESLVIYRRIGEVFEQHFRGEFHEAIGFVSFLDSSLTAFLIAAGTFIRYIVSDRKPSF